MYPFLNFDTGNAFIDGVASLTSEALRIGIINSNFFSHKNDTSISSSNLSKEFISHICGGGWVSTPTVHHIVDLSPHSVFSSIHPLYSSNSPKYQSTNDPSWRSSLHGAVLNISLEGQVLQ
jgi:hypothetical protein